MPPALTSRMPPPLELDHVFVATTADEAAGAIGAIEAFGLQCGGRFVHAGQGTANACFFFENAYLELLWIRDERETRTAAVAPLTLAERLRWRETGASPFGVGVRGAVAPVATWDYAAPYTGGVAIPMVTPPDTPADPLVFVSPGPRDRQAFPHAHRPPVALPGTWPRITGVKVSGPEWPSHEVAAVLERIGVTTDDARMPLLTLSLGTARTGAANLQPRLPLILRW